MNTLLGSQLLALSFRSIKRRIYVVLKLKDWIMWGTPYGWIEEKHNFKILLCLVISNSVNICAMASQFQFIITTDNSQ